MSSIRIVKKGITEFETDAVVNAANSGLWHGGGVCGAIFDKAGAKELEAACSKIGHCDEGNAVITPGFKLPARYIIHAVGPRYSDGNHGEPKLLYSAYMNSLRLCLKHDLHSIAFPLISSGIFGYPKRDAWRKAIQACNDFINENSDFDIDIFFAVLDDKAKALGESMIMAEAEKTESGSTKETGWE